MKPEGLKAVLEAHAAWRRGEPGGKRANLRGADLRGATIGEHVIKRLIARVTRISDQHEAFVFETKDGGIVGKWGCREMTLAEFEAHAAGYGDPDKRAESENIIAHVRAEAKRLGVSG